MKNEVIEKKQEVETPRIEIDTRKLDSWLIENLRVMEELTLKEPICWREVDTPG